MDEVTPTAGSGRPTLRVVPMADGEDIATMLDPGGLLDRAVLPGAAGGLVLAQPPEPEEDLDPRPLVDIGHDERSTDWLRETIGTGPLSSYFLRGGQLVHCVTLGEAGFKEPANGHLDFDQITPTSVPNLLARLSATYRFRRWNEKAGRLTPLLFPRQPAANCVEAPAELPNVRTLQGIVNTPIVRPDGSILTDPGYDADTGLVYLPNSLDVGSIAARPSAEERAESLGWLSYMIADFPFETADDHASFLGSLLVPMLRSIAPPPYKLLAINAHAAGSGKGYLAEALRTIHHGPDGGVFRAGLPHAPDEFRKWITSVLDAGGGGVVQLDNIRGGLGGDVLEGLLTSYHYNDRRLGVSENVHSINDRLWVATGNNITLEGDMARRTVWCTINPQVESPENRTQWRITRDFGLSFPAWVAKYRSRLVHSLLVLLRAWVSEGMPRGEYASSDSYAEVTRVVRGILAVAGVQGTYDPKQAKQMSEDDLELARFLHAVVDWKGGEVWTASELLSAVELLPGTGGFDRAVVPMQRGGSLPPPSSLGKWLGHRKLRGVDGLQLYEAYNQKKTSYWAVSKITQIG